MPYLAWSSVLAALDCENRAALECRNCVPRAAHRVPSVANKPSLAMCTLPGRDSFTQPSEVTLLTTINKNQEFDQCDPMKTFTNTVRANAKPM